VIFRLLLNLSKLMKKGLLIFAVAASMILTLWVSVPLVWYPKFGEIDTASLTEEVDTLFAVCDTGVSSSAISIPLNPEDTPYVISLDSQDIAQNELSVNCASGVRLKLWDDWWDASAGLFVVREGHELPAQLAPLATPLNGRVYSWHDTSGSQ